MSFSGDPKQQKNEKIEFGLLEQELQALADAQKSEQPIKKVLPGRGRQGAMAAEKANALPANKEHQDMNASFGRHSGRGNRREEFYQFKRQDSNDSSKLNELIRRSQEG